jgi:hypothetical protein
MNMTSALLDTAAGRAMLSDAIRRGDLASPAFTDRSPFLNPDPWPLFVRYAGEKAVFVPRDRYFFQDPAGPSACLWIVPGSTR